MSQDSTESESTVSKAKVSKVKQSKAGQESETQLEPVTESQAAILMQQTSPPAPPSHTVVESLIQEISQNPSTAIKLIQTLGKITRDWEPIGSNGNPVNEIPVPPGKNPRDFIRSATTTVHISGFRLSTIFGDEVAYIMKDSPKWRVTIEGEYQTDTPFVEHSQKAESNAKKFAEDKLKEKGYIIGR